MPDDARYESVLVERDGPVGIVTFNRPDQLNAWDWTMSAEMNDALGAFDADDEVRAIVLTGAGRAFCAGAGLQAAGRTFAGRPTPEQVDATYPNALRRPSQLRTPVVAALNGAAVGAGMTIAMQCDLRIAAQDAKYGFVFNRRGVIPDADLLWSLPRQIGLARAMDLLLTGRIVTGREAYELGLVSRALPAAEVRDAAVAAAYDIARNVAPVSAAITKLLAERFLTMPDREQARDIERHLFWWTGGQPDAAEGVDAFRERRDPRWTMSKTTDVPPEAVG